MGKFKDYLLNESSKKIGSKQVKLLLDDPEEMSDFDMENYEDVKIHIFDNMFGPGAYGLVNENDKMRQLYDEVNDLVSPKEYYKEKKELNDKWSKIIANNLNRFAEENRDKIIRAKKLD